MDIKYFAYGSNMSSKIMTEVCPTHKLLGPARLMDHRLAFTRKSAKSGSGVADIVRAPGLVVWGLLYEIDQNEVVDLDRKEDLGKAYTRINVNVALEDGSVHQTMTYTVISKAPIEIRPSTEYLDTILQGAKDHNFEGRYTRFLESLKADESRWCQKGTLVFPTKSRKEAAGMYLLKVSKSVAKKLGLGAFAAVVHGTKACLVKVAYLDSLHKNTCQIDQAIRNVLGFGARECYGVYVSVFAAVEREFVFPFVRPRSLAVSLESPSVLDSEKKICVIHRDNFSLLGLNEGDYVTIRTVVLAGNSKYRTRKYTVRAFTGSKRKIKGVWYPRRGNIYVDLDGRLELGIPEKDFVDTPAIVSANVWKMFSSRFLYYGITLFLGMVAITPLVQEIVGLPRKSGFALSVLFSISITLFLCIFDVRGKVQY